MARKTRIRLAGGRWYAFMGTGYGKRHLLVSAIGFCNRLNNIQRRT